MDTDTDRKTLGSYLNDHLAGASAACELLERAAQHNNGSELGEFLTGLLAAVRQDRDTLAGLMHDLGIETSTLRKLAGSLGETASRVRLDPHVTGDAALTRLLELETLYLGVEGKHRLWRSLRQLADTDTRLDVATFDRLVDRAVEQLDGLERHRLTAASEAFAHA